MSDVKQVKVDNWGIYFLQRLKHFFNRTDYCDLTLQFQDNAQLKVHRLVLSACTEYFELLERTCEMYEDCLVMPDDLQADVIVPIVNFMYTGHLEFKMDLLERLYQTSQILNMPVLTKLLESHRNLAPKAPVHTAYTYSANKKVTNTKPSASSEPKTMKTITPSAGSSNKRSYSKAFEKNLNTIVYRDKKTYQTVAQTENVNNSAYRPPSPISKDLFNSQKLVIGEPRPTRYEVPEELDTDNIFDNSFCSISYTSQPLMVHPDTVKRYKAKRSSVFSEASGSKKVSGLSTIDIVECKRISSRLTSKVDNLFDDNIADHSFNEEADLFNTSYINNEKDQDQLFNQILDSNDGNSGTGAPKVTIESKDSKAAANLDHARIISEVLKKYPHLVKSNKNIKLKILDPLPNKGKRQQKQIAPPAYVETKSPLKLKTEEDDFTYETDVIDSKQAAKLIAMGADNTKGPWICLICGTPGKALHFNSYYKFRRHLVEVHNEKPVVNICEYCGLKSLKRNYLMHHLYSQHGVQPPPQYHFPKCNSCSYIALTDALLNKHKQSHKEMKNFRCNVCSTSFTSSTQLLQHIQSTGHKYTSEKKNNLQCPYCMKVFLREMNLYSHIKTNHKEEAKTDCIIEDSDDEKEVIVGKPRAATVAARAPIKFEPSTSYDNEYVEIDSQYPILQRTSIDKPIPTRRQNNAKQKILNPGFDTPKPAPKAKPSSKNVNQTPSVHNDYFQDVKMPIDTLSNNQEEEIVLIDNNEYIMKDHQLIPRKRKSNNRDYIISDMLEPDSSEAIQPSTSVEYTHIHNTNIEENMQQQSSMVIKKSANLNQPIQIVVSNEEEYKALMASNHPIIFDDGSTNKTLTVLTGHQSQELQTTALDLDNTQGNEVMILPNEYPLNVSEGVTTENSNIVVVYSHPVDDQNKQFQIISTGGIEAQFVQSSAIITQNYGTVTTSTTAMNTHHIESQGDQTWQNNIQSLDGQQIQLPPDTVMIDSNQVITGPIYATGHNLHELPEVHLVPEPQKGLSPETDVTINQPDVTIEQINHPIEHEATEDVSGMSLIEKETTTITVNETVETLTRDKSKPNQTNHENIVERMEMQNMLEQPQASEHVMEQPMRTDNDPEHPMETENVIEQQMDKENALKQPTRETENITDQSIVTEYVLQQPLVTENAMVMEQTLENEMSQTTVNMMEQSETGNIMEEVQMENMIQQNVNNRTGIEVEQPIETETPMEQPEQLENIMKQPAELENVTGEPVERENILEQTIETECLVEPSLAQNIDNEQEQTVDTINKFSELDKPENNTSESQQPELMESQAYDDIVEINKANNEKPSEGQQPELMESQAYDDIVEINKANNEEPACPKVSEKKIKHLTLDWSDDEYDIAEDSNRMTKVISTKISQNQPPIEKTPEVEESIENIQQEMQKQIASQLEAEVGDAEAAAEAEAAADVESEESLSSLQEDTSSQDMQLPPLMDSPIHTTLPNPIIQHKISSLLNDWEDNDSHEELISVTENTPEPTTDEPIKDFSCTPENTAEIPKNDKIKSLVSDWDDDEEEIKE